MKTLKSEFCLRRTFSEEADIALLPTNFVIYLTTHFGAFSKIKHLEGVFPVVIYNITMMNFTV